MYQLKALHLYRLTGVFGEFFISATFLSDSREYVVNVPYFDEDTYLLWERSQTIFSDHDIYVDLCRCVIKNRGGERYLLDQLPQKLAS